jgi:hypothetical protein
MRLMAIVVLGGLLASASLFSACAAHKGSAQRAGEKIDNAADKVSDTVNPKGPAQRAGRALDRATGN